MIPDPIEQMETRQDARILSWNKAQRGVPQGQFRCPSCRRLFDYTPIQVSPDPDSDVCCYDCLPDDLKKAYDDFFGEESDHE